MAPTDPQIPQWGTSKTWAVQLLMPAQSPLLHAADCLEWAPGEQEIKSKPEKDSFLKKKEGKSAKPCGPSLCPAAAESRTFGKRQKELNCFTPELLLGRQSTTHAPAFNCLLFLLRVCVKSWLLTQETFIRRNYLAKTVFLLFIPRGSALQHHSTPSNSRTQTLATCRGSQTASKTSTRKVGK